MKRSPLPAGLAAVVLVAAGLAFVGAPALGRPVQMDRSSRSTAVSTASTTDTYVVLVRDASSEAAARRAVAVAGGTVVEANAGIGTLTVEAPVSTFVAAVRSEPGISGVAASRAIGHSPDVPARHDLVEHEG
ncbi:MAG: peptidase, partial [Acidimicrobiales bacterium]|nr:peptidase [Acidimicrobiales bacterium]